MNRRNAAFGAIALAAIGLMLVGAYIARLYYTREAVISPRVVQGLNAPFGQEEVVRSIHEFLGRRIRSAATARRTYWKELRRPGGTFDAGRARADLRAALGVPEECAKSSPARLISRELVANLSEGRIERRRMEVCSGLLEAGLVGLPRERTNAPLVVVMHGTNATPERMFGVDDPAAMEGKKYHNKLGRRLQARGFVVFAPLLLTETRLDKLEGYNKTRNRVNQRALPIGLSANGLQIGMVIGSLRLVVAEAKADPERIGIYGVSHGGQLAFYLAALDKRFRASVISQWFENRIEKLVGSDYPQALWRYHDSGHNFYGGMLLRFTDIDVARLIAPRALFVEAGADDIPRAQRAAKRFPALLAAVREAGTPAGAICIEMAAGAGHEAVLNKSALFLERWLLHPNSEIGDTCPLLPAR